jgi:hypothetical protein
VRSPKRWPWTQRSPSPDGSSPASRRRCSARAAASRVGVAVAGGEHLRQRVAGRQRVAPGRGVADRQQGGVVGLRIGLAEVLVHEAQLLDQPAANDRVVAVEAQRQRLAVQALLVELDLQRRRHLARRRRAARRRVSSPAVASARAASTVSGSPRAGRSAACTAKNSSPSPAKWTRGSESARRGTRRIIAPGGVALKRSRAPGAQLASFCSAATQASESATNSPTSPPARSLTITCRRPPVQPP